MSYADSFPFGPFSQNQTIQILGTVTNSSADKSISLCEGVCIGDSLIYSLGAWASLPNGYDFHFGNGGETTLGFLNGQIAGVLDAGESKSFVFGEFLPSSGVELGTHNFLIQLQIFSADILRPMIGSSTFSGTFQVVEAVAPSSVPEPETYTMLLAGLGMLGWMTKRRNQKTA